MAYVDFPDGLAGQKKRKEFWLSEEGLALLSGWRRQGVPLLTIATECIGISKTAFWGWYHESENLRKAMAVSLDIANANVENALYRRAVGYDHQEEEWGMVEGELRRIRVFTRHIPPDTKAIMQWLFNRLPNRWRAQQEPLEATQYAETIKNILVAMKEVSEDGKPKTVEATEGTMDGENAPS